MRSASRESDRPARGRLASPQGRSARGLAEPRAQRTAHPAVEAVAQREKTLTRRKRAFCPDRSADSARRRLPPGDALLDLEGEDLDDEGRPVAPSGRRQERRELLERGVVIEIEQDGDVFKKRANTLLRSALRLF
jgi:hypothetical protein